MNNQQIAETIMQQMNTTTGRIRAMLGGTAMIIENGLQINFKGCRKANKVQIVLDKASDTYTVKFFKYNRRTFERMGRCLLRYVN